MRRLLQSRALLAALVGFAILVAVGCGSSGDDNATFDQAGEELGAQSDDTGGGGEETGVETGDEAPLPAGQPISATRAIIATSDVTVVVEDSQAAARRVADAAEDAGGFVSQEEAHVRDGT